MGGRTVMIVPGTVPGASVLRMPREAPEEPTVISAEPGVVPPARAVPVAPDEITPEQVARLRQENQTLRAELDRARAS
jgi:hypothetical protein